MCPPFFLPPGKNADIMERITNSHFLLQNASHDEDGLIIKVGGPRVTLVKDFIYCGLLMWGSSSLSHGFLWVFFCCCCFSLWLQTYLYPLQYISGTILWVCFVWVVSYVPETEYSEIGSTAVGIESITAVTGHLDWQFFIMASISMKINMRLMNTNYNEEE